MWWKFTGASFEPAASIFRAGVPSNVGSGFVYEALLNLRVLRGVTYQNLQSALQTSRLQRVFEKINVEKRIGMAVD